MAIPEVGWVHPVIEAGTVITAVATAWRLRVSNTAVDGVKVKATVELVNKHDERLRILEDSKLEILSEQKRVAGLAEKADSKMDKLIETTNQMFGEMRAHNRK